MGFITASDSIATTQDINLPPSYNAAVRCRRAGEEGGSGNALSLSTLIVYPEIVNVI